MANVGSILPRDQVLALTLLQPAAHVQAEGARVHDRLVATFARTEDLSGSARNRVAERTADGGVTLDVLLLDRGRPPRMTHVQGRDTDGPDRARSRPEGTARRGRASSARHRDLPPPGSRIDVLA